MRKTLSEQQITDIVNEVTHSFAVEDVLISARQKEEVKRVLRGEISFSKLTETYINKFSKMSKESTKVDSTGLKQRGV